jgi:hypothetical protein
MAISDEQQITVEQADRVLRQDYWDAVRSIATEAEENVKSGEIEDEDGLTEWLEQSVDGSSWVIYTRKNFQVLLYSDNESAFVDDFGADGLVKDGDVNWAGLAYMAMLADVRSILTDWDDMEKPVDPDEEDEEDEAEDAEEV